jgi:hypothetical protein
MKRIFFYCFLLVLLNSHAIAQNVVFSANASANTIGVQDQVQVTFSIQNVTDLQGISQPSFPDFKVVGGPYQSQSSNISFNGNQRVQSISISFTYVLQPAKTGTFTIPPIFAKDASGKSYQCNPLTIQVVAGAVAQKQARRQQAYDPFGDDPFGGGDPFAAIRQQQAQMQQMMQQLQQQAQGMGGGSMQNVSPQSLPMISEAELGKNVFIKVIVDKTKVRLGEQITAIYKLYSRIPMQAALSKLPSLNGFWTQDFELLKDQNQKPVLETVNGVQYQTFTVKKSALFPQQTGILTLDAAEAKGVARLTQRTNDPFSPYSAKDVQINIKSAPVSITVTPLPEKDKPQNFSGAVGNFSISSKIDKTQLSTDETINLTINIAGSGNLKLIQAPQLQLPNGLDVFDPQIIDTITGRSTTISGNKIITYAIAPRIAGDYVIPAVAFSYFNSDKNTYTTLYTQPFKIHVTAGKNYKEDGAQNKMPGDIHAIDTQPLRFRVATTALFFTGGYWSFYIVTGCLFLLFLLWKHRDDKLAGNTTLLKNKRANKIALRRLKMAKLFLSEQKTVAFYEEISKAIWLYLSDKLDIPLSQLSKESATQMLTVRNVHETLQQKTTAIIDNCELALYSQGGGTQQMNRTYEDTISLIGQLEEIFKS